MFQAGYTIFMGQYVEPNVQQIFYRVKGVYSIICSHAQIYGTKELLKNTSHVKKTG